MKFPPKALITGITGQDGSFLAELLLEKGYAVTGVVRDKRNLGCASGLQDRIQTVQADLIEPAGLRAAIELVRPHEIYHLAAPSVISESWARPHDTMRVIVGSCAQILETVRDVDRRTRIFVAASSMMFDPKAKSPQTECTPYGPTTPYAIAKLAAHQLVGAMRTKDHLHVSSGILYNHESERRPVDFVSRKITRGAAAIKLEKATELELGSLESVRDWSFAGDIMRGAWLMLQQSEADDYVLASGRSLTVGALVAKVFAYLELDPDRYVHVNQELVQPPEPSPNVGEPTKAHERLGWQAEMGIDELVERMVLADLRSLEAEDEASAS